MIANLTFILLHVFFQHFQGTVATRIISFRAFEKIHIYSPVQSPKALVLFISGNEGWNTSLDKIATGLSNQGAIVVGINEKNYIGKMLVMHPNCYYPAGDLEELSLYLQKTYHLHDYKKPILAGYGSGASLVYGSLAQAPSNTFKGAFILNFNPTIRLTRPLCKGDGLMVQPQITSKTWYLEPNALSAPLLILQPISGKFTPEDARKYVASCKNAELTILNNAPKDPAGNYPDLLNAYKQIRDWHPKDLNPLSEEDIKQLPADLPVKVIPAKHDTLPLIFFISGDGGWTSFDQSVSETFAQKGLPVIGLDAQKYFWERKSQEQAADDISKAIIYYLQQYKRNSFILMGYSFGASITPFITNHMPANLRKYEYSLVAISPDDHADFEIHVADMLSFNSADNTLDVIAEMKKMKDIRTLCIFGSEESVDLRNKFRFPGSEVEVLPGNHHFNYDYQTLVNNIFNWLIKKRK